MKPAAVFALVFLGAAIPFTSCVSPHTAALTFPRPQVSGLYAARLTKEDVEQITEIPFLHPNIRQPVQSIDVQRPDQAKVTSYRQTGTVNEATEFKAEKKNGRWTLIEASVIQKEIWIAY